MTSRINSRRRHGFTLAELTLVGALLGMIVLLCWPSLRGVSKRLVDKADAARAQSERNAERERKAMAGKEAAR